MLYFKSHDDNFSSDDDDGNVKRHTAEREKLDKETSPSISVKHRKRLRKTIPSESSDSDFDALTSNKGKELTPEKPDKYIAKMAKQTLQSSDDDDDSSAGTVTSWPVDLKAKTRKSTYDSAADQNASKNVELSIKYKAGKFVPSDSEDDMPSAQEEALMLNLSDAENLFPTLHDDEDVQPPQSATKSANYFHGKQPTVTDSGLHLPSTSNAGLSETTNETQSADKESSNSSDDMPLGVIAVKSQTSDSLKRAPEIVGKKVKTYAKTKGNTSQHAQGNRGRDKSKHQKRYPRKCISSDSDESETEMLQLKISETDGTKVEEPARLETHNERGQGKRLLDSDSSDDNRY